MDESILKPSLRVLVVDDDDLPPRVTERANTPPRVPAPQPVRPRVHEDRD
jgi:hypothetical protein